MAVVVRAERPAQCRLTDVHISLVYVKKYPLNILLSTSYHTDPIKQNKSPKTEALISMEKSKHLI